MTGFGGAQVSRDGISVLVEMKSLNSRFLEVVLRLPKILQSKEYEIREIIRHGIARGKISVFINFERDPSLIKPPKLNIPLAKAYVKALRQLKRETRLKGDIEIEDILKIPEIFNNSLSEEVDEKEWDVVEEAIRLALAELKRSRMKEGSEIMKDIEKRIDNIAKNVEMIQSLADLNLKERQRKLKEKVEMLFKDVEFDRTRLENEIILLADRFDVTEECVRLRNHIKFFTEVMESDEISVGRRLNFLLQEMNREATTISAKADNAQISHLVVQIKEEIEKIREQLQNVE